MPGRTRRRMPASLMAWADADFQMRIAVEFDEFNRRAQQRGGFFRLGHPLRRRAVGSGFAARTNDKVRRATGAGFFGDDTAAPEFDVVGMRAKGQQRARLQDGISVYASSARSMVSRFTKVISGASSGRR